MTYMTRSNARANLRASQTSANAKRSHPKVARQVQRSLADLLMNYRFFQSRIVAIEGCVYPAGSDTRPSTARDTTVFDVR